MSHIVLHFATGSWQIINLLVTFYRCVNLTDVLYMACGNKKKLVG